MCDMLVFARVAFEDYSDLVITGYPLHANFKSELAGKELEVAAIFHKNPGHELLELNDTLMA